MNVQKKDVGSYRCTVSTEQHSTFDMGVVIIKKCPPPNHACGDLRYL